MQEAGIPITYAYVSDAHDGHGTAGNVHFAYGPGEAGSPSNCRTTIARFRSFLRGWLPTGSTRVIRCLSSRWTKAITSWGCPMPSDCDGVTTPCNYNRVGEINGDLRRMVFTQFGDATLFSVHSDDAPTVYVNGTPTQPLRDQTDPIVRNLEREMAQLSWLNPYTGAVENNIMAALVDHTGMKTLHMVTADPFRTQPSRPLPIRIGSSLRRAALPACATPDVCASIPARTSQSFAWNHGDIQEEIATTWVGYVGHGVQRSGIDHNTGPIIRMCVRPSWSWSD